ncbi:MAG TPA: hypothetical protein VFB67_04885 [Candidatus Polarisedimenticolaceae bacterium]|nr:hypothetical protein [Candidatus Polarisedimenticolaceae bacterium]
MTPTRIVRPALALLAFALLASPARSRDAGAYSMELLVDGRPLSRYETSAATYVEALRGREYAIRLSNRTGERVAVALAVDGLNTIDARHTAAAEARKWILGPWESTVIDGWQTSSGTARRFVFTSEPDSYGAWLGRTRDLGVVSAAFFRERPRPAPIAKEKESDARREKSAAPSARADDLAATGIGREVEHRVVAVAFDAETAPSSVLSVRYEYRDALVRLGVLPRCGEDADLARRERARGFSDDGFAPDPHRGR